MLDYFISYAAVDRDAADLLVGALEEAGVSCFIDHRDIPVGHSQYRHRLMEGIQDSECMIVLLSPHSQASDEVFREVQAAHDRGRRRFAVWLGDRGRYTNPTLEMLLSSSQDAVWSTQSAEAVADEIRAVANLSSLRESMSSYASVADRLQVDLAEVFASVESFELGRAVQQVAAIAAIVLRDLWIRYESTTAPPPEDFRALLLGCRDHFEHESFAKGFAHIESTFARSAVRAPTMDETVRGIEHLMTILSVLRTTRWEDHDLLPNLREDATFISGLMLEAGWLRGAALAPGTDAVYMVFERLQGEGKRYLEILLGKDERSVGAIAEESQGKIYDRADAPITTRFLVLASRGSDLAGNDFLTTDDFVIRFTGLNPSAPSHQTTEVGSPLGAAMTAELRQGHTNLLVYGEPKVGKSAAMRALASRGWPGAPTIRFYIDYAESDQGEVEDALEHQVADLFPILVRSRAREIVGYLVRTGRAALFLDSIECAAPSGDDLSTARVLARLCNFLSHVSVVILAGRDAALRDSAAVRSFVIGDPTASGTLTQTLRSTGIDPSGLPRFEMVRARRARTLVTTPSDRQAQFFAIGMWEPDEHVAASALMSVFDLDAALSTGARYAPPLSRPLLTSLARGSRPSAEPGKLDLPRAGLVGVDADRGRRELRCAIDYVGTALLNVEPRRWFDLDVGEAVRRLIRLLSVASPASVDRGQSAIALAGPPNGLVAVQAPRGSLAIRAVTAGDYREFLGALPSIDPRTLNPDLPDEGQVHPMYERAQSRLYRGDEFSKHPAVAISWWGADAYARWRGTRLPTSLEWEYAARGWDGRIFPWGDHPKTTIINCADSLAGAPLLDYATWRVAMRSGLVAPRASRPTDPTSENRSPVGCLDMVGNVWEWVDTAAGDRKVMAGGSYDNPLRACVGSSRGAARPHTRSNVVGFRVMA